MPIVFARVDDRLIHGQVVQAWLPALDVDEVLIPCPAERATQMNNNLLRLSLPFEYELTILEPDRCMPYAACSKKRILLLLRGLADLPLLLQDGLKIKSINIGGMHFKEGAQKLAENVFLDKQDKTILRTLKELGIEVETREVPASKSICIKENFYL